MAVVDWVQSGEPHAVSWVIAGIPTTFPGQSVSSLESLTDVEGTLDAPVGSILSRDNDGKWRPISLSELTGIHITHNQPTSSTEWVIDYSSLPFTPAGVRVFLSDGSVTQPGITDYPETKNLVLEFSRPRSGRAEVGA